MNIDRSLVSGVIRTLGFINVTEDQIDEWENGSNNNLLNDLVNINEDESYEYFSD